MRGRSAGLVGGRRAPQLHERTRSQMEDIDCVQDDRAATARVNAGGDAAENTVSKADAARRQHSARPGLALGPTDCALSSGPRRRRLEGAVNKCTFACGKTNESRGFPACRQRPLRSGIRHEIDVLERQAVRGDRQTLRRRDDARPPGLRPNRLAGAKLQSVRGDNRARRQAKLVARTDRLVV